MRWFEMELVWWCIFLAISSSAQVVNNTCVHLENREACKNSAGLGCCYLSRSKGNLTQNDCMSVDYLNDIVYPIVKANTTSQTFCTNAKSASIILKIPGNFTECTCFKSANQVTFLASCLIFLLWGIL
eukprot:TRINITY_DN27550_c0_g1_i1.p2 TRINITY_DN27550_c0_g1~~TRINITY_DN27550_c0_g1_i1.p2  ORF type:complete len:128 (-),score=7.56 TRINITY_DN27550_c0_g1_i1:68-451(-)